MNSILKKGSTQIGTTSTSELLTRISYGNRIIGYFGANGTKVLNTGGTVGSGEIVIDGKALNRAEEFIDADVSVTNAARQYVWAKCNCNSSKRWEETKLGTFTHNVSINTYSRYVSSQSELEALITSPGSSTSLDWTSRSVVQLGSLHHNMAVGEYYPANNDGMRAESSSSSDRIKHSDNYAIIRSKSVFLSAKVTVDVYRISNVRYEYSQGSYIGTVISTDIGKYPDNGRHSDGYWYKRLGNSETQDSFTYANNCTSSAVQYIRTGVIGDDSKTYRIFYDTQILQPSSRGLQGFGGSASEYWGVNNGKYEVSTLVTSVAAGERDLVEWEYSPTGQRLIVNGVQIASKNRSPISGKELQLFAINGSYLMTQMLYGCVVLVDGVLTKYFVPAIRHSDYALGYRDMVSGEFYPNAGSGVFS